jgi:hypothetical protein
VEEIINGVRIRLWKKKRALFVGVPTCLRTLLLVCNPGVNIIPIFHEMVLPVLDLATVRVSNQVSIFVANAGIITGIGNLCFEKTYVVIRPIKRD